MTSTIYETILFVFTFRNIFLTIRQEQTSLFKHCLRTQRRPHVRPRAMPPAVFSLTNNTVDKEYNLADFKQLIRSGNNTIRMNCGWTYCHQARSTALTLLLGKSGSEAVSQLQRRIARGFSSNSFVNTMDMMAVIQYILTAAQSLGSQVYCKRSRMTILGLAGVLFCKNDQA